MKTAVFRTGDTNTGPISFSGHVDYMPLSNIISMDLSTYHSVFILGSFACQDKTSLTSEQINVLWAYVKQGGICYGEMIEAFDFPTSRLLGWKQDYPRTVRTMEKLCMVKSKRELLEWSGSYMKGFRIFGQSWLDIGHYPSTHYADDGEGGMSVSGLIVHKLGAGTVVYAAFPMLQSSEPWAFRPHGRWQQLVNDLVKETHLPLTMSEPVIQTQNELTANKSVVENCIAWFTHSGIMPSTDGKLGVFENIHSITAQVMKDKRPDCHVHTALMFNLYGRFSGNKQWEQASHALMEHILTENYQDLDASSATYGFFKWYEFPEDLPEQIFTDDNAWICIVLLYLYRKTRNELYKERGLLVAEALLNTQHDNGLRANCLSGHEMREKGANVAKYSRSSSMNPHFESIAHVAFIQAYLVSEQDEYLDVALKGSLYLLENLSEHKYMYSKTSGLTRLLLPLVYLTQHDDSGKVDEGIAKILQYLLSHQHKCGAIEEADNPDPEKYGKEDTGVFRYNREGIADQLYTNNFLLMNAWEGWKQTDNQAFKTLHEDLSSYLCSIQIKSDDLRFHGAWMRAFDLNRGEYFGNNGDTGWGPYCIESGWTNAIINCGLLLQMLDESIYE